MRICRKCTVEKVVDDFRGKRSECRACERAAVNARNSANPDRQKQQYRTLRSNQAKVDALNEKRRARYGEVEKTSSRNWQRENKEAVQVRMLGKAFEKQRIALEARSVPCLDCNLTYPVECMDFDHVTGDKIDDVSAMVTRSYSIETFKREIEKCQVVCANCHRIRTRMRKEVARNVKL